MAVSIGHLLLHELRRSSLAASSHDSDKRPEAGTRAEDVRVGRSASSSSLEVNRGALPGRRGGGGGGWGGARRARAGGGGAPAAPPCGLDAASRPAVRGVPPFEPGGHLAPGQTDRDRPRRSRGSA